VRRALHFFLKAQPGLNLVGETSAAESLLGQVEATRPEVVLLDWELPGCIPAEVLKELRQANHRLRVIALTRDAEAQYAALAAGANGFISKSDPPQMLLVALQAVNPIENNIKVQAISSRRQTMLDKAQTIADEIIRLRRDFHQHPELSLQEVRTASIVADTLKKLGMRVETGVAKTGVVGHLGPGEGPTIAIRADMDALPIQEQNDVPYKSQNDGVMHACGHDVHTSIALGAAHLLADSYKQGNWRGNVRFVFQPSEEKFDDNGISGGTAMLQAGALDGVEAVIALHVFSPFPAGVCHFQAGYSLASGDAFEGWLRGDGGHGAYPHTGSDPCYILGHVLSALYAIPSRRINPLLASVVSVGQITGGATENVIPNEIYMQGTMRAFEPEVREKLWAEIENAFKLSEGLGGHYELKIRKGYPSLYNDPKVNGWLRTAALDLVGESGVANRSFGMGAEDFAYIAQKVRGAMFFLGGALDDGREHNHHTSTFDVDERALPVGAAVLAETARRFVCGELPA
jgi:amidohydrolase